MKTAVELQDDREAIITWFFKPVRIGGKFVYKINTKVSDGITKHNGLPEFIRIYDVKRGVRIDLLYSEYVILAHEIDIIKSTSEHMLVDENE